MKKRHAIIWLCGLVCLLASCSGDKTVEPSGDDVPVKIMARSGGGTAGGTSLNSSEDVIRSCRVYIFDASGKLDRVQLFKGENIAAGMSTRAKVGAGKRVCIVVNEPDVMLVREALDKADRPEKLNQVLYTLADYVDPSRGVTGDDLADSGSGYVLPMYGENTVSISADDINNVAVSLERCVARVDIYLRLEKDAYVGCSVEPTSLVELGKAPLRGYFAPVGNPAAASASRAVNRGSALVLDKAAGTTGYKLVWSFYVPSQRFAEDDDRYLLTVKGIDWEGDVADYSAFRFGDAIPDFDNTIRRNTRYELYCTLSQVTFTVDLGLVILDWSAVSQDSHI